MRCDADSPSHGFTAGPQRFRRCRSGRARQLAAPAAAGVSALDARTPTAAGARHPALCCIGHGTVRTGNSGRRSLVVAGTGAGSSRVGQCGDPVPGWPAGRDRRPGAKPGNRCRLGSRRRTLPPRAHLAPAARQPGWPAGTALVAAGRVRDNRLRPRRPDVSVGTAAPARQPPDADVAPFEQRGTAGGAAGRRLEVHRRAA